MKRETLEWLARNTKFTKRFAYTIGKRCQSSSIKEVATEYRLDWKTVKELEKQYLQEKLRRGGTIKPHIIGIDEIAIAKGHAYRIVVSDLEKKRPIWFGGMDRSEASMDLFYQELGSKKCAAIRLAVMDMWRAFEASAKTHIPHAAILYDKFHIMRQLNTALDKIRRSEYARVSGEDRKFIKGQKYNLLSRSDNLSVKGKQALKLLLKVNKRLNTAYILKESFDQVWGYRSEKRARMFFDNWCDALKNQNLKPYEDFANIINRHWDGIAAFCKPENKVSLGFVEGLNNKIRVIQRRAYGLRDEQYLRLKVLTSTLPDFHYAGS